MTSKILELSTNSQSLEQAKKKIFTRYIYNHRVFTIVAMLANVKIYEINQKCIQNKYSRKIKSKLQVYTDF